MDRDLKDLYEALGQTADTDAGRLPGAQTVRQRTDRRTRLVTVAACVVAAVLIGVVSVAARPFFIAEGPPTGAVTPTEIPDSAFLVLPPEIAVPREPFVDFVWPTPTPSQPSESPCGLDTTAEDRAITSRIRAGEFKQPPHAPGTAGLTQIIVVFSDGDAARIMADQRTAFGEDGCSVDSPDGPIIHRIVDAEPRGDESTLIEIAFPDQASGFVWIMRFGDVLTTVVIVPNGPIHVGMETIDQLTDLAEQAVRAWLN